jgi:hypothetical protein
MNEGWQDNDYLILLEQDESAAAMEAYCFDRYVPGYRLVGLKGWGDFIVVDSLGTLYTVPTVPLDASYASPLVLPQEILLKPDSRLKGRIRWHLKPLVFGGNPADDTNIAWVSHAQHRELVCWWNEQYRSAKAHKSSS